LGEPGAAQDRDHPGNAGPRQAWRPGQDPLQNRPAVPHGHLRGGRGDSASRRLSHAGSAWLLFPEACARGLHQPDRRPHLARVRAPDGGLRPRGRPGGARGPQPQSVQAQAGQAGGRVVRRARRRPRRRRLHVHRARVLQRHAPRDGGRGERRRRRGRGGEESCAGRLRPHAERSADGRAGRYVRPQPRRREQRGGLGQWGPGAGDAAAVAAARVDRDLFPELRTVRAGMSVLPLGLARGLVAYLEKYPYGCTEQLVSQGVPAMVLARRPEFGINAAQAAATVDKVLDMLRSRQNEEGAYGLWAANTHVDDYVSVYAQHFLLDAKEHGFPVPPEVLSQGAGYLQRLAGSEGASLFDERTRAYAIYLLTRHGVVTSGYAMSLERRVQTNYADAWRPDLTGAFLAATYQLLHQDGHANSLIAASRFGGQRPADYQFYDDGLTHDAMLLYLLARHFPARLGGIKAQAIDAIVTPVEHGAYNSLSSAYTIMGLDAYVEATGPVVGGRFTLTETLKDGSRRVLPLPAGTFPLADVSAAAAQVGYASDAPVNAFYLLSQAGFDRRI